MKTWGKKTVLTEFWTCENGGPQTNNKYYPLLTVINYFINGVQKL